MDERVKFIARLLDGEALAGLCEEFAISRKTGYKILKRYRDFGVGGSPTARGVPTGMPTSCLCRSRR
jgi:Helix-turn-helix domain